MKYRKDSVQTSGDKDAYALQPLPLRSKRSNEKLVKPASHTWQGLCPGGEPPAGLGKPRQRGHAVCARAHSLLPPSDTILHP